ncbi:hypothetical protein NQ318_008327 [Aromia moschata]|uniref:Uncharacterized protein n=1 Tax=Aromia moschata TaxID=1265417 RepID=A0AAV8XV60_9CUCU|nr:hypothetical protein NQ318_008327 [Aromia moschata]
MMVRKRGFDGDSRWAEKGSSILRKVFRVTPRIKTCLQPLSAANIHGDGVRAYQSEIYVKMQSLPTSRFKRIVVRTTMDLVVSIGGIAGLFIGASILSIVEMVYLIFIRKQIKAVILQFNSAEAAAIKESLTKFQDVFVETALKTLRTNYNCLYDVIQKLQNSALSLAESLQIVDEINSLYKL